MKKELPLIALGIIAAAPAFASQQSTSQGFIEDSHLDLFLRNAYIKRDYRDGLPDKAEWGQGIIATFESGFTQGPVGFGVDGIAQYAVRLDGGRGRSGAGGIDF
ncbi:OprD family outer membrane porin, partial [Klebsiella pneumoniae]